MSWAAHNPERYSEIVREGIVSYIEKRMVLAGFDQADDWHDAYVALVETIENDPMLNSMWFNLMDQANTEIVRGEQNYFGSLIDQAKERFDA